VAKARLTLFQRVAAALALGAIAIALSMLFGAERGLSIMHTDVDGIPVSVFAGRDAPPAPAVLVGHGFAGSRQLMHPFALTLARNGYVAVVFDFPGHGRNPTPLAGTLGEPERAEALLDAFERVARYARDLPASDGRLATLGHSMAGDILIRYADIDPNIDASIAVSPYLSRELGADGPHNLLFIYGEYEPAMILDQGREAVAMVPDAEPADIQLGRVYGDMAKGDARGMVISEGVEHIGVLFSANSLRAALGWLNQVYGIAAAQAEGQTDNAAIRDQGGDQNGDQGGNQGVEQGGAQSGDQAGNQNGHDQYAHEIAANTAERLVDARGPWLLLFFAGVVLLAWPLSSLLPRVATEPLGAGLRWRRLLPLAIGPALLTPLILWPLPSDFLPIVIGDYIALHFGLFGLLTMIGLLLVGQRPAALLRGVSPGAFVLAVLLVMTYETLLLALPTDRFLAAYVPGVDRIGTVLVLFVGTLLWFAADEWLTRGGARGAYALTKVLFVVSLMLAVVLNRNELFFLVIIIPAILALFVIYGLFSGWVYRRTQYPLVAALTNALAFASAIAVSFPIVG